MKGWTAAVAAVVTLAASGSALAHDLPAVRVPDGPIVVLNTRLPSFRLPRHVRLVYHSPEVAARLGVNEYRAYEEIYGRTLTDLLQRMSFERADPIARHSAWHAVVGQRGGSPVGEILPVPRD